MTYFEELKREAKLRVRLMEKGLRTMIENDAAYLEQHAQTEGLEDLKIAALDIVDGFDALDKAEKQVAYYDEMIEKVKLGEAEKGEEENK